MQTGMNHIRRNICRDEVHICLVPWNFIIICCEIKSLFCVFGISGHKKWLARDCKTRWYLAMENENIVFLHHLLGCACLSCRLTQTNLFLLFLELVSALDTQKITLVSCGRAHSMAVNDQGQVFAWGAGGGGQLGLGTAEVAVRIPR